MGKNEFILPQIIDITKLQQKEIGGTSSNENLILVETAYRPSKIQPGRGGGASKH